jgi:hypothetical protein
MATTATALSDKQLEADLYQLQSEAKSLQKKIGDDARRLDEARSDRQRIVDGIARGAVKESEAPRIKAEIESIEIRLEGNNSILATNRAQQTELGRELGRRQDAVNRAAREKQFAQLCAEGENRAKTISELLTRLVTVEIPAFDATRRALGVEFGDLGGEQIATRLREMLVKFPGPRDKMHDSNVHLRRLFDEGWVHLGEPGPSYQSVRSSVGQPFVSVPGGELSLTVCSLRPKK